MNPPSKPTSALFQVYLRLRPPPLANNLYPVLNPPERFLIVEESSEAENGVPSHITINPPNDSRRRAVEKFAFTQVFEEEASQLDMFHGTGVRELVEGVLGPSGGESRDGLLATLGVTGSGKSHTILGSKSQRGLTQLALDVLFRSIAADMLDPISHSSLYASIAASDCSEAQVLTAQGFFDMLYSDGNTSRASSRAATPMRVRQLRVSFHSTSQDLYFRLQGPDSGSPMKYEIFKGNDARESVLLIASLVTPSYMCPTSSQRCKRMPAKSSFKGDSMLPPTPRRMLPPQRPSALPSSPDISSVTVAVDPNAQYAIVISMYEVYNDRIFDLLTPASRNAGSKEYRRRPLLYKHTEGSPDRKVVAGLRKIICGNVREALMVLEAGLHERRVAGTGSNSVSSRSHGFFCVEVKKRRKGKLVGSWGGSALTIVDLAGSERARDAKTQGATLAEAGKINESLMYLGQCLQMQSDAGTNAKPNLVPYRQCKLTELLFSNSFPSGSNNTSSHAHHSPQRGIMIVTADPVGDFNATSQILRYSALAREITVPRLPSVSSTILANAGTGGFYSGSHSHGRHSPTETERETMEIAALEIARMSEEIDGLRDEVRHEQERRMELEAHLLSAEDRIAEVEQDVREECYQEMEKRMTQEMQRWKALWESERERGEAHVDRKLEVLTRGIESLDVAAEAAGDEGEDKENVRVESLEDENERLRLEIAQLKRQLRNDGDSGGGSPTKKRSVLGESRVHEIEADQYANEMMGSSPQNVSSPKKALGDRQVSVAKVGTGIPVKKVRKFTARKWDLIDADDML